MLRRRRGWRMDRSRRRDKGWKREKGLCVLWICAMFQRFVGFLAAFISLSNPPLKKQHEAFGSNFFRAG